jgi:NAD(P)-dependent dehydrogenase (short-subunit alcohol dehydrogenase family)
MTSLDASTLLRPGVLDGRAILLAGGPSAAAEAVEAACAGLGASIARCLAVSATGEPGLAEAELEAELERALPAGAADMLVVDAAGIFASAAGSGSGEEGARDALRVCLEASWSVTRALVNRAFLAAERPGRVVYVAPPADANADAGVHADAARAGLENLARTLSVEWARHGVTVVTVAPGSATPAEEVAALVAYLASPAGAYFSGCLLDLRGPATAPP